ncbi:PepSY-associated TM helix domain-containing protein [Sphingomonas sp. S2M10]|uniref:PepSY domain-containing protein n=1 Tax=Sphingomonas sp. S2M10 TaxID=2705010 RepID=UPI001B3B2B28
MLGLAFAVIIYLVCLTGTIAVFAPDLQRLELPRAPAAAQLAPDAAARALGAAAKQVPGDVALNLTLPSPERSGARLIAFRGRFERNWAVAEDGGLTPLEAPWTEFLLYLHICLHLRRNWGGLLVSLTGVALLSSLVSGILAHPRVLRDAFHLRLGGSRRLQEADLHNQLGIWALPFHFTLALTGLSTLIVAVLALLLYRGDTGRVYALFLDPPPPVDARGTAARHRHACAAGKGADGRRGGEKHRDRASGPRRHAHFGAWPPIAPARRAGGGAVRRAKAASWRRASGGIQAGAWRCALLLSVGVAAILCGGRLLL